MRTTSFYRCWDIERRTVTGWEIFTVIDRFTPCGYEIISQKRVNINEIVWC